MGGLMKGGSHIGEVQSHTLQGRRVVVALESHKLSSFCPVPAVLEYVPAGQAVSLSFHQRPTPLVLGEPLQLPAVHRGCRGELTPVSPSRCAHTSGSAVGMLPWLEEWRGIHSRGCRASSQWQGRRRNPGEGHARRPGQLK